MRVIDLSHHVDNAMPGVSIAPARRLEKDGWNATTLSLYSHSGTHMDAPCHFLPSGPTLDEQDLSACVGMATIIDLTPTSPRQLLTVKAIEPLQDSIQPGARLLLRTDWHKQYGTPAYRNELPRVSLELAHWFVSRGVSMIGVEPPSVADVNNLEELTLVHQALFRGNVLIVEGLANLDQISSTMVEFIALPLKVTGGDGSPVRAIAIER